MSGVDHRQENSRKRPIEQPAPTINLKVKAQDGVEMFFRIKRSTMLLKLLMAYCQKRRLEYQFMQFFYNGERFPVKQSPDDLNMEDGDEIDAMMHQNGGGCVSN